MELFAPRHLLIILLVCLLVFGTKKLKTIGADLGGALRGFKQAMKEGESLEEPPSVSVASPAAAATGPATAPAGAPTAAPTIAATLDDKAKAS